MSGDVELDSVGYDYALRKQDESVVARVALNREGDDWPWKFVRVARLLMNAEGDASRLSDEDRTILVWPKRKEEA